MTLAEPCHFAWCLAHTDIWHHCVFDDIAHECPHKCGECGATFDRLELTTPRRWWWP